MLPALLLLAAAASAAEPCPGGGSLAVTDMPGMPVPGRDERPRLLCSGGPALAARLLEKHGAAFGGKDWTNWGPDAARRRVELRCGEKRLLLESWHPLMERGGEFFAHHDGVRRLEGRVAAQALAAEPADYRAKRAAFDAIVAACRRAAPKKR